MSASIRCSTRARRSRSKPRSLGSACVMVCSSDSSLAARAVGRNPGRSAGIGENPQGAARNPPTLALAARNAWLDVGKRTGTDVALSPTSGKVDETETARPLCRLRRYGTLDRGRRGGRRGLGDRLPARLVPPLAFELAALAKGSTVVGTHTIGETACPLHPLQAKRLHLRRRLGLDEPHHRLDVRRQPRAARRPQRRCRSQYSRNARRRGSDSRSLTRFAATLLAMMSPPSAPDVQTWRPAPSCSS